MSLESNGIRTSIFVDPIEKMVEGAKNTGTDRIELYTEAYAQNFKNPEIAIAPISKRLCGQRLGHWHQCWT